MLLVQDSSDIRLTNAFFFLSLSFFKLVYFIFTLLVIFLILVFVALSKS